MKSCFSIFSILSATAQQGEALLWSSWLQKHPETELISEDRHAAAIAPWDDPDMKSVWDRHAADTYYLYWEQYLYWTAQGWTTDQSVCPSGAEAEAAGVVNDDTQTHTEDRRNECRPTEGEDKGPHHDTEGLSHVFGQSCTLEAGLTHTQSERELCGSDEPSDGGNERKRPASSSQQSTVQHAGKRGKRSESSFKVRVSVFMQHFIVSYIHLIISDIIFYCYFMKKKQYFPFNIP